MKNVIIKNIHNNRHYPDVIYAELREVGTDELCVAATLNYIFKALSDDRDYQCVNATKDAHGNYTIT